MVIIPLFPDVLWLLFFSPFLVELEGDTCAQLTVTLYVHLVCWDTKELN